MALTVKSLDAVTASTDGEAIFFDKPLKSVSLHYTFGSSPSPSPSNFAIYLEGTVDGSLWVPLATQGSGGGFGYTGLLKSNDVVVQGIRAKYEAVSNPPLTVWIAACDL